MFTSEPKIAAKPDVGEARPFSGASPTSTSHRHTAAHRRARRTRRALERAQARARTACAPPRRVDIYKAIPEDSRRARSQPQALRALEHRIAEEADLGRLRADAERNALTIARALVFSAHWRTLVARPGWDTLTDRTGLSRSTIAKYLALFNTWGLLGRVRTGSTWQTRGAHRDDEGGNLAGEYVLCVPADQEPVEETRTPSLASRREPEKPLTRARETRDPEPTTNPWPIGHAPQTRRDQLRASKRLLDLPVFRDKNARYIRSIFRPVFEAGWSPAQIRHALDHTPAGVAYWHTETVRHPAAWAKARLAAWQNEDGTWATPPVKLGAGRSTDLEHRDVVELAQAPRLEVEETTEHASTARRALDAIRARLASRKPQQRVGLGVSVPDADGTLATATEAETSRTCPQPPSSDDWLLRNAATQARQDSGRWDVRGIA